MLHRSLITKFCLEPDVHLARMETATKRNDEAPEISGSCNKTCEAEKSIEGAPADVARAAPCGSVSTENSVSAQSPGVEVTTPAVNIIKLKNLSLTLDFFKQVFCTVKQVQSKRRTRCSVSLSSRPEKKEASFTLQQLQTYCLRKTYTFS